MSDTDDVIHEVKPSGWRLGGLIYADPNDARVFVPRRPWWTGWTVNLARPLAWIFLAGLLLLPVFLRWVRGSES